MLRHTTCPMLTCMDTVTITQTRDHHQTDNKTLEIQELFNNPVSPKTKKGNFHVFYYSTLVFLLGLSGILVPLNLGNAGHEQTAQPALAASIQHLMPNPASSSPMEPQGHDDDTLAALTIYFEAKGESFAGKLAVAAVIRNRMAHHFHSDGTVRGTVLRPKQFEPWITRNPDDIPFNPLNTKMQESLLAWKLVQDGRKVVNGAVLFYNPDIVKSPRWAQVHRKVAKIGGHEFFHTERI